MPNTLLLLLQRLTTLDEGNDDEASGVHHVLSIFENMIEVKPEVADMAVEKTKVVRTSKSISTMSSLHHSLRMAVSVWLSVEVSNQSV